MSKSTPGMGLVLGWGQDIVVLPLMWASNSDVSKHRSAPVQVPPWALAGAGMHVITVSYHQATKERWRKKGERGRGREKEGRGRRREEEEGEGRKEGEHRWRTDEGKKRKGGSGGERTNQVLCLMPWKTYIQQNLCSDLQVLFLFIYLLNMFFSLFIPRVRTRLWSQMSQFENPDERLLKHSSLWP